MSKFRYLILCIAVSWCSTQALAFDTRQPILDASGNPSHENANDASSPLVTLGQAISLALLQPDPPLSPGRPVADPMKKAVQARLALRIIGANGEVALSADEVKMIERAVASFPPLTILRILQAIDPSTVAPSSEGATK